MPAHPVADPSLDLCIEDLTLPVRGHGVAARWLTPSGHGPGPVIVFLHEALGSIGQWKDVPARLCAATGLRGFVYDRLGHGGSDPPPGSRSPDYLRAEGEAWLPAVLEAAGLAAPPVVVGHSDGGSIALHFAAARPTAALVTEAAHVRVEAVTLDGIRDFATALWPRPDIRARLARYHGAKTEALYRAWHDTWLGPDFAGFDMTGCLPAIACPSLIVQGADDPYGTPRQVEEIVAGIRRGGRGAVLADSRLRPCTASGMQGRGDRRYRGLSVRSGPRPGPVWGRSGALE